MAALGSRRGSSFHLELCGLRALKSGRLPLSGLRSISSGKGTWLTAPARIAGVGHGHRDRPAPSAGRCSGRGSQPAGGPAERQVHLCLPLGGTALRFQGRTWRFLVHLQHIGVLLAAEVRPGSNYAPPRCTWHLQVHL
jgi:hypothetical protein